jgi:hypothetical protein
VKAYKPAIDQVREILGSRSQAEPLLEARDIWDLLDCWPVPSVRTVQRYMNEIRNEGTVVERQNIGVRRQTSPPHAE